MGEDREDGHGTGEDEVREMRARRSGGRAPSVPSALASDCASSRRWSTTSAVRRQPESTAPARWQSGSTSLE